jgi:hypothetical protein
MFRFDSGNAPFADDENRNAHRSAIGALRSPPRRRLSRVDILQKIIS